HEWPVLTEARTTKKTTLELKIGDWLPVLQTMEPLTQSMCGSYDDGFTIGWNLGDGWQTERESGLQIGFIVSDGESYIRKTIENYLKDNCNWKGSFDKEEINVNNTKLRSIFNFFDVKHKSQGLPKSVWTFASEEFRKGIIDGLFSSDGS